MSYRFTPPEGRDSQTLPQVLARRVACQSDTTWIAGETRSWTCRDIDAMSGRIANGLAARGIGTGETVLVMLPDCVEFTTPRTAYFMVPRHVEVVDALPRTQMGKTRKYAPCERGLTPQTRDREVAGIRLRR